MKKSYRNIVILTVAICFSAVGFTGDTATAQTKKNAKAAPTPNAKKTPAKTTAKATPKPAVKTSSKSTSKSPAASKTAKNSDKTKTNSKDKSSSSKNAGKSDKTTNKTTNKTAGRTADKSKTSVATKSPSKQSSKSTIKPISKPTPKPDSKPAAKITPKYNGSEQVIVMSADSKVRQEPKANAMQLSFVKIGKTLPVSEKNAAWYRVEYETGKSGWISKTTVKEYDTDRRDEIYQEIANRYSGNNALDFTIAAEVSDFLRTAHVLVRKDALKAELAFKRLQILSAALKAVPFGKSDQSPYKPFLKLHDKEVVYSEPAGQWFVRSDLFWELHNRYIELPVAEDIAWEAAKNPIPGECEGYINCRLYVVRAMEGEYLNFYPNGRYAKQALELVTASLGIMVADMSNKDVFTPLADISDRAEFNRFLTELRTIISKVPDVDKAKPLQQITELGEGYK